MEQYTPKQRAQIVELYIKNSFSIVKTQRAFRKENKVKFAPTKRTIHNLYEKFRDRGNLGNVSRPNKKRTKRTNRNIARVKQSVERAPETSAVCRSSQLNISRTTLRRIMHDDLNLFPYKIQCVQQLLPLDKPRRVNYAKTVIDLAATDVNFWQEIIMSDEAHFCFNGTVNKQICRFYATENPQLVHEEPLHDQKVTVWCGMCADRVIGPYFFEDENGATVTVNGERYRAMVEDFLMPIVESEGLEHYWFQQDGATAHTSRVTIDLVSRFFPNRVISKNGDIDWPARSPDLTPPDFFLWGYLKSKVYNNKPKTLRALKNNIRREIAKIPAEMLAKTMENAEKRRIW